MDNMEVINSELTGYTKPREDKEKYDLIFGDIKGTVSVILSGPSCSDVNVRFTMIPLKPLSN